MSTLYIFMKSIHPVNKYLLNTYSICSYDSDTGNMKMKKAFPTVNSSGKIATKTKCN